MKKILVIRFSSIGDIVLTTPVLRCLKQQIKDAEIHYLTKASFADILKNNPYVSKVHTIEKNISEIISVLKAENFHFVVDLHKNIRSLQVKLQLQKPSTSFSKLNLKNWLSVNFKIKSLPLVHIVDRYMETLQQLGVANDNKGLDYFIPEKDAVNINSLPAQFQKGYIGFVIGARHVTKQMPVEKIVSVCKKINEPIILLGGKEDVEQGEKIKNAVGEKIYNACGKYNLNQSASIVKQAKKIITHDTGLMHIAAAFKKDILSVWGNTIPEFGMFPYLPGKQSKIIEVKNLSCRPCSKIGYSKCPKGHFDCMMKIDESLFSEQSL